MIDEDIAKRIRESDDEQLLEMINKPDDYLPEAIAVAREEIERRGGRGALHTVEQSVQSCVTVGSPERIKINFVPSLWLTNLFQGQGFIEFHPDHLDLNGRKWSPAAILILLVVSTPFGIVPGLIPTYFFGRKRKTVRIEYDSKLSFSMTDQASGVLVFASGHKIRESKIRATPEGISRIAELLSRDHDQ